MVTAMRGDGSAPVLSRKDFVTDQEVRWCPGCGDYSILAQTQKVMPELGVPRENIVGKPLIIYWSYDAPTENLANSISLDHMVDLLQNFFIKTRWRRTFRLVHAYPVN